MRDIHVFLNGDRGLAVFDGIHAAGHEIASVIIPAGRKVDGLEGRCRDRGIALRAAENVNDPGFCRVLQGCKPELFVVAGFSAIFKRDLHGLPRFGTINLHAGRLPQYRGGSPLNWQMINHEPAAGLSVIRMDDGIDTGPVLAKAEIPIGPTDTIADLHAAANKVFPELTIRAIEALERDGNAGGPQDEGAARYWHQRSDADGRLHPDRMSASDIDSMVRALTRPYPGAFALRGSDRVRIFKASIPNFVLSGVPGRICWIQGQGPFLVCADRAVLIEDYRFENQERAGLRHGDQLH